MNFHPCSTRRRRKELVGMKVALLLLAVAASLTGLDIATLDGKAYHGCAVSKVYPDSLCILFPGGGARIKFTNLPESLRGQFGYDAEQASTFERAEAARQAREQALLAAQRLQSAAQRRTAIATRNQPSTPQSTGSTNSGSEFVAAPLAAGYPGGAAIPNNNQGLNQAGNRIGGATYVGVRMAGPGGGIRGVTASTPVSP